METAANSVDSIKHSITLLLIPDQFEQNIYLGFFSCLVLVVVGLSLGSTPATWLEFMTNCRIRELRIIV